MVAIVAVGARRRFLLRPAGGGSSRAFDSGEGDLLVMGGTCQRAWQHAVPKVSRADLRITIQFRSAAVGTRRELYILLGLAAILVSLFIGGLFGRLWKRHEERTTEKRWQERERLLNRRKGVASGTRCSGAERSADGSTRRAAASAGAPAVPGRTLMRRRECRTHEAWVRAPASVRGVAGGPAARPAAVSVMEDAGAGRALFGAFGVLVLALALWVVDRSPTVNWIAWLLAAPAVLLSLLGGWGGQPQWLVWAHLLESALYFYAAAGLIAYMLGDHRVTADELFAAGATFTLLAWAFAFAYCRLPGRLSGQLHRGGRPSGAAELDGAAVPELHDPVRGRPRRRHADQPVGARAGDAGGVRGRDVHRAGGVTPHRPDHRAASVSRGPLSDPRRRVVGGLGRRAQHRDPVGRLEPVPVPLRDDDQHPRRERERPGALVGHDREGGGAVQDLHQLVALPMPLPGRLPGEAAREDAAVAERGQHGERGLDLRGGRAGAAPAQDREPGQLGLDVDRSDHAQVCRSPTAPARASSSARHDLGVTSGRTTNFENPTAMNCSRSVRSAGSPTGVSSTERGRRATIVRAVAGSIGAVA